MTTLQAMSATVATCIFGIFVLTVIFFQILRHHGNQQFEAGWIEGWDDRDNDHHPETPEPKGRHHGISQPEDWTATDLIEFTLPPPPLPKRIPGART